MTKTIDQEIEAIRSLLVTLEPLDPKVRESVLDYVLRRLDIKISKPKEVAIEKDIITDTGEYPPREELKESKYIHIKQLKEQKEPRSAIEMAALVAYYLSHKVPPNERKDTITTKDIETYFKIAEFKLPTKPKFTLQNTKIAGYVDAVGDGEYKLNPVGYNLVVHSMPKKKKKSSTRVTRRVTKKPAKKPSKRNK